MWIYAAVILLLSGAWCEDTGINHTSLNSSTGYVVINSAFNLGSEVNLTCSNKTWDKMLYVIWKIELQYKKCEIAIDRKGTYRDFCNDGKTLRNTSSARSYLHIQNISANDEGVYTCESTFDGGIANYVIHVSIRVPPSISAWLEHKDDTTVAVCKAEGGKPAANVSWSHAGNASTVENESGGFFTVESRLELLEGMDTENLSCVIRHPYWTGERMVPLKPEEAGYSNWLRALVVVVIVVLLAGMLFLVKKQPVTLRQCRPCKTSSSKSPQTEDVEDVEPYASYVQRVNSIYNSSADLFK